MKVFVVVFCYIFRFPLQVMEYKSYKILPICVLAFYISL